MTETLDNKIDIESMIYEIRGKQVMLDCDVAKLYDSQTKVINQVVKRNINRFPLDFCFQLTTEELNKIYSRSHFVTLNKSGNQRGKNIKYLPYVFTEHGIMMLSGLLKSDVASKVNILIINAFVQLRKYTSSNLIEQKYINNLVIKDNERINLLEESFSKLEKKEKVNEIYFNGQIYDAYSKIIEIMKQGKEKVIIIDNYADKSVLDMISKIYVKVILITKKNSLLKNIDIEKYNKQYNNLEIMYNDTFHDRYILIDNTKLYHLGSSINYAGSKTFSINIIEDKFVLNSLIKNIYKYVKNNN